MFWDFPHLLIRVKKAVKVCASDTTVFIMQESKFVVVRLFRLCLPELAPMHKGRIFRGRGAFNAPFSFYNRLFWHNIYLPLHFSHPSDGYVYPGDDIPF